MTLIYIENTNYLKKILSLFLQSNISCTTNFDENFDTLLIAELNNRTFNLIKKYSSSKKIIFWFHLEEVRFCYNYTKQNKSSILYKNKLYEVLKMCTDVVVSLPFFKDLFLKTLNQNIYVIPKVNPNINTIKRKGLLRKYNYNKKVKKILVIDYNYQYLEWIYNLSANNNFEVIYIDYTPLYDLSNRKKQLLKSKPKNLHTEIITSSEKIIELLQLSDMVIYLSDLYNYEYLIMTLLSKKTLFVKNFYAFDTFLINSKNCYIFDSKEKLLKEIEKYLNNRISNLSENGFDLIKNNTSSQIIYMIDKYFK